MALRTVVGAGDDMAAYRQRWKEGRWWWWMGPGDSMQFVGTGQYTRMTCPVELTGTAAADEKD